MVGIDPHELICANFLALQAYFTIWLLNNICRLTRQEKIKLNFLGGFHVHIRLTALILTLFNAVFRLHSIYYRLLRILL